MRRRRSRQFCRPSDATMHLKAPDFSSGGAIGLPIGDDASSLFLRATLPLPVKRAAAIHVSVLCERFIAGGLTPLALWHWVASALIWKITQRARSCDHFLILIWPSYFDPSHLRLLRPVKLRVNPISPPFCSLVGLGMAASWVPGPAALPLISHISANPNENPRMPRFPCSSCQPFPKYPLPLVGEGGEKHVA